MDKKGPLWLTAWFAGLRLRTAVAEQRPVGSADGSAAAGRPRQRCAESGRRSRVSNQPTAAAASGARPIGQGNDQRAGPGRGLPMAGDWRRLPARLLAGRRERVQHPRRMHPSWHSRRHPAALPSLHPQHFARATRRCRQDEGPGGVSRLVARHRPGHRRGHQGLRGMRSASEEWPSSTTPSLGTGLEAVAKGAHRVCGAGRRFGDASRGHRRLFSVAWGATYGPGTISQQDHRRSQDPMVSLRLTRDHRLGQCATTGDGRVSGLFALQPRQTLAQGRSPSQRNLRSHRQVHTGAEERADFFSSCLPQSGSDGTASRFSVALPLLVWTGRHAESRSHLEPCIGAHSSRAGGTQIAAAVVFQLHQLGRRSSTGTEIPTQMATAAPIHEIHFPGRYSTQMNGVVLHNCSIRNIVQKGPRLNLIQRF